MTVTDSELIEQYRSGSEKAFDVLYQRYRKPLYSYLNRLAAGQPHLADDIYQQTWIRILDRLDHYSDRRKFLAWACKIAHNLLMDHFRQETRREVVNSELGNAGAPAALPAKGVEIDELRRALDYAVAELPLAQREVFLLRQQGLAFKEIARIQRTSINTALARMQYAILKLRDHLAEFSQGT